MITTKLKNKTFTWWWVGWGGIAKCLISMLLFDCCKGLGWYTLIGHWVKPNSFHSTWVLSLSELPLKNSLRNNHSRQSSDQLACWLPTLSETGFKGFHMFANQPLLVCMNCPSLLLLSHLVYKNTRLLILENI